MTALGADSCRLHSRRAAAYHNDFLRGSSGIGFAPLRFSTGNRVVDTPHGESQINVPHAALRATDTGANVFGPTFFRLVGKVRIGDEGLGKADQVLLTIGNQTLGKRRRIDAPSADYRQVHHFLKTGW